jgi:hypothetical protein
MKKKESIKVYWAPVAGQQEDAAMRNILYKDPINVLDDVSKLKNRDVGTDSYLFCPAYKAVTENMFYLESPSRSEFIYHESPAAGEWPGLQGTGLGGDIPRGPSLIDHRLLRFSMGYIFFAEEPLLMELTPPYLHETEAAKYGKVVPGQFDVGKWFRAITLEYELNAGVTELKIEKDEPMAYVRFMTDRPVELVRFDLTDRIRKIADSCVQTPVTFGRFKPLQDRYDKFMGSRSNELALKYIKENLL